MSMILKIIRDNIVAKPAPEIPYKGTKIKLRTILIPAAKTMSSKIILDFPFMEIRSSEIPKIAENKALIDKNLNAFLATVYSSPKKKLIKTSGNIKKRIKKGAVIIKTHFPICLLNCLTSSIFPFEYSFVTSGKKSCLKISRGNTNNNAIGTAAL